MMPAEERTFRLHVPSSTENLAMIRDFVGSIGQRAGLDQGEIAKLELAVDEACANVIEHAYGSDATREVTVKARVDEDAVSIEIVDTGKGFDPSTVQQDKLDQLISKRKSGGLGMRLIQTLMDEVQYEIIPGQKNALRMVKKLKKKDAPASK